MTHSLRTAGPQHLRTPFACLLAFCLCYGGLAALADQPPVARFAVRDNFLLTKQQVLDALGVREGEPLDEPLLEAAVAQWNESGLYGAISYEAGPAMEGEVEAVLTLEERVRLTRVSFSGDDRFSPERLAQLAGIKAGDAVGEAEVRSAERMIANAYREEDRPVVPVSGRLSTATATERELAFYIGRKRAWVEEIRFQGNRHVHDGELLDAMKSRTRAWISFFRRGWFDEDVFREDLIRLEAAYHDRGYQDAQVEGSFAYGKDMRRVTLYVTVQENQRYYVKEILFEGNTLFRDAELQESMPIIVGERYRADDLDESAEAISALYADQGYWDVTVAKGNLRLEAVPAAVGAEVTVKVRIVEGEPVYIRHIKVRGLTRTKEAVVRRNLTFYPGERASAARFRESEQVLRNTGYFARPSATSPTPIQIGLEPREGALRDAVVRVEEGRTGRISLGGGIASESGLLAHLSVVEENFDLWNWPSSWDDLWRGNAFRGGGHKLSLLLSAGTRRSFYAIAFEDPAVWNTEYSFGTSIYSRGIAREEFDETRTGASVTVGQGLTKFLWRGVTAGYETIDVDNIGDAPPAVILRDEGSHSKPFVRFRALQDRRDDRYMPTEGHLAGAELELAAGDVETVKLELHARKYWTVRQERGRRKHVVGVRGRLGLVDSYSGDVPVFERFYAGGFSTLRGFEFEGVSPSDPATGAQIGGESMLLGSVEYSFPLSEEAGVRLVTFCDAGYVSKDVGDIFTGWDELRLSVGAGIRWQVAYFGPLVVEFDLAAPLLRESDDETQAYHFSFGLRQAF